MNTKKLFTVVFLLVFFGYMNSFAQMVWNKFGTEPVLQPGSPGEWDDLSLVGGCVIYDGTDYKMWYGGSNGTTYRIGLATSTDGINWTKYNDPSTPNPPFAESDPVLNIGPGAFESVWVYFPQVYFDGSTYHMWYVGYDGSINRIGYATSPDGIVWTKDAPHNPVIDIGPPGSWDDATVATGPVQFNGTNYEMIYNGSDGQHFQGGYATSTNGFDWVKDTLRNPVLIVGANTSWNYPNVQPHSVVYDSFNSKYYLYYSGGESNDWRIGCATADSFSGLWAKDPSIIIDTSSGSWDNHLTAFPFAIYDPYESIYEMWYTGASDPSGSAGSIGYATTPPVPVELTSFTVESVNNEVLLNWSTATELNNQGFEIQRSNEDNNFVTIGFVKGNGTSTEQHNYTYTDKDLTSGKYYYRLKQVDFNGSYEYLPAGQAGSDVVKVTVVPNKFSLEQNYPDPFNPSTTIKYSIPNDGMVSLKVYDILGNEVMTLVNKHQKAGDYTVEMSGANLSSGIYVYTLESGPYNSSKKMILLK